jgi:hypothetical protein
MNFTEQLKAAKPKAAASSLKTYNTILKKAYKTMFGETESPDIEKFRETDKIFSYVNRSKKPFPETTRKTILSAVTAIAPMKEYRDNIYELQKTIQKETDKSQMTPKLQESEITPSQMADVIKFLKKDADAINKKSELTMKDIQQIQNYVIVSLYHGHIAPRRAIDFTEMVLKPTDKKTQNYIDMRKSKFVFNKFKTANEMGSQEITIPASLKKIIKAWILLIPTEVNHLLFNSQRQPLSNVSLGQRLNEIFGEGKSVNSLRHYFLTQNHSDTVRLSDKLSEDMTAMGSSTRQVKNYVKINAAAEPE